MPLRLSTKVQNFPVAFLLCHTSMADIFIFDFFSWRFSSGATACPVSFLNLKQTCKGITLEMPYIIWLWKTICRTSYTWGISCTPVSEDCCHREFMLSFTFQKPSHVFRLVSTVGTTGVIWLGRHLYTDLLGSSLAGQAGSGAAGLEWRAAGGCNLADDDQRAERQWPLGGEEAPRSRWDLQQYMTP